MGDENTLSSTDLEFLTSISNKFTIRTLLDAIKNYSNVDNVKFQKIEQVPNNFKKGDSYMSSLFRFIIIGTADDGTGERLVNIPVVVKSIPKNIARKKTFRSQDFFKTEINFYTKVWPKLLEFQKEKNAIVFNNVPRCLATICDGDNDFIILEDISTRNFKARGRGDIIDLEHCLLVIRMFGSFHAVSLAFKDQHPIEYEQIAVHLKEVYYSESFRKWYKNFMDNLMVVWTDAIEKEVPGTVYETKLKDLFANDLYGQLIKIAQEKGKYAVVNQGDTWLPNLMFQYNDNKPQSVFLIDFQLSRNCSFVLDLSFFILACVQTSIRRAHWDEILTEYHKTFTSCLEKLGSRPELLTYDDLKNEFAKYFKFGLGLVIEAGPFSVMPDEEAADLDAMKGDGIEDIGNLWIVKKLAKKEHRLVLVNIVKDLVDKGYL
ncbi:uncharacterized protein LOC123292817 [Chrysoperla carnea]|uniref:uncharacterized protein LOC123292817 n=1 Tax=Chrysoperla carnea TaxID=189513 RepID=UPI001D096678|nr:uncharacterized protein LOC123292817 [Chrysoperla carnea]